MVKVPGPPENQPPPYGRLAVIEMHQASIIHQPSASAKHWMREIMDHVHDFTVKYKITPAPLKSYP